MILLALHGYYHRLQTDKLADIASEGFQTQEIPFIIVIDRQGTFRDIVDTRSGEGKKKIARNFTVPKAIKKTSGIASNLLWEVPAYVFGKPKPDPKRDYNKLLERAKEQQQCFTGTIRETLASIQEDYSVHAVLSFLDQGDFDLVFQNPAWQEIEENGSILSFQIEGETHLVCESHPVEKAIRETTKSATSQTQTCLITGEDDEPTRLHTAIKGVYGAQTSGANIVSFNLDSSTSYGKVQSFNAPVGKRAEFAYTTALNHLLAKGSRQRMQVGDASTVFWAEKPHQLEDVFASLFGEQEKGEPEQDYKQLIATFRSPMTGAPAFLDPSTKFFVLGLSPNAARIAIRFWYAGTVSDVAANIEQHFLDIEIDHGPKQPRYLSLFRLLVSIATQSKSENIPPNIAGVFMKSILTATPYPVSLLGAAIRRCRAEREVSYPRVSLIKAVLVRQNRFYKRTNEEVGMSLDISNSNTGYRLGRLFAVLEKIQEESHPGINATIRDRFYGSASATPVSAFPHLMKLKNHHVSKLENRGRAVNFERKIGEIMDGIVEFPSHLSLPDQGRFAVGYYHQRQSFFIPNKTNTESDGGNSHE